MSKSHHPSSFSRKLLESEAEYAALRDEILKRIELQYQLLNLALIVAGTFLTISLSGGALTGAAGSGGPRLLLLLCTPLEMFLALGWADHNVQIAKAGVYIRTHYDEGWETSWPQNEGLAGPRKHAVRHLFVGGIPAGGIFVCTQILTLLLAVTTFSDTDAVALRPGWRLVSLWPGWYVIEGGAILLTFLSIYVSNIRPQLMKAVERKADRVGKGARQKQEEGED